MAQQATTAVQTANSSTQQVAKAPKKVDILKSIMNADSVQEQFKNALGKNAGTFVASVIDLYNSDSALQECEPKQVVMEALKAAVLHLPINKALGYAYVIPYKNTKKDSTGRFVKVYEPSFQMGYKGYVQLAMRTGQYRTINADAVYEGELRKVNKLSGEIAFDGEKKSDKVVGYFCYFELLNGFSKTLYMTVEQMAIHAKRYSKGLVKYDTNGNKVDVTVESLVSLADLPMAPDSKTVGWLGNFHGMAIKTVIRNLLSKYGYLSIELQNAITNDADGDDVAEVRDNMIQGSQVQTLNMEDADYEEVGGNKESDVDPGF